MKVCEGLTGRRSRLKIRVAFLPRGLIMTSRAGGLPDASRLQRWLLVYLAVITGEDSGSIDPDAPLAQFDLDSVDAVEMASQFEKTFVCRIGPESFLQGQQSVRALVPRLLEAIEAQAEEGAAAASAAAEDRGIFPA